MAPGRGSVAEHHAPLAPKSHRTQEAAACVPAELGPLSGGWDLSTPSCTCRLEAEGIKALENGPSMDWRGPGPLSHTMEKSGLSSDQENPPGGKETGAALSHRRGGLPCYSSLHNTSHLIRSTRAGSFTGRLELAPWAPGPGQLHVASSPQAGGWQRVGCCPCPQGAWMLGAGGGVCPQLSGNVPRNAILRAHDAMVTRGTLLSVLWADTSKEGSLCR